MVLCNFFQLDFVKTIQQHNGKDLLEVSLRSFSWNTKVFMDANVPNPDEKGSFLKFSKSDVTVSYWNLKKGGVFITFDPKNIKTMATVTLIFHMIAFLAAIAANGQAMRAKAGKYSTMTLTMVSFCFYLAAAIYCVQHSTTNLQKDDKLVMTFGSANLLVS